MEEQPFSRKNSLLTKLFLKLFFGILYQRVLGVANYEFDDRFQKFEMADPK